MNRLVLATVCALTCLRAHADGPNYEVFPQIKNLKVNYHVETRKKQTILYVTNHGKNTVICDAVMITNRQEKTKGHETSLAPGRTTTFSFTHGLAITDVRLYLMCETSKETDLGASSGSGEESAPENPAAENPPERATVVIEEDLDKM